MWLLLFTALLAHADKVDAFAFGVINRPVFNVGALVSIGRVVKQLVEADVLVVRVVFRRDGFFANRIVERQGYAPFFRKQFAEVQIRDDVVLLDVFAAPFIRALFE